MFGVGHALAVERVKKGSSRPSSLCVCVFVFVKSLSIRHERPVKFAPGAGPSAAPCTARARPEPDARAPAGRGCETQSRHHALFRGRKATRNNKTDPMQPLRTTLIGLARHAPGKLSPGTPRKIVFPYPQKGARWVFMRHRQMPSRKPASGGERCPPAAGRSSSLDLSGLACIWLH